MRKRLIATLQRSASSRVRASSFCSSSHAYVLSFFSDAAMTLCGQVLFLIYPRVLLKFHQLSPHAPPGAGRLSPDERYERRVEACPVDDQIQPISRVIGLWGKRLPNLIEMPQ
jgi:hypothetical protein